VADVAGLPVIDGTRICAAAFQGKAACFEIIGGNTVWSRDISTATGLAIDDKSLYLADDQDQVHALDRDSGASRWKQDKLLRRGLTRRGGRRQGDRGRLPGLPARPLADDGAFIGGSPLATARSARWCRPSRRARPDLRGTVALVRF